MADLAERATALAALGDPVRLAIVDELARRDASPGELRSLVGVTSNLLAHHLNVLEGAGLIDRHRSHGDRRRTYLRLRPARLAGLLPDQRADDRLAGVERVVFVCTANSARSQLAEALWREASAVPATSAGTHPAERVAPGAVAVARRRGLRLVRSGPTPLDGLLDERDLVVTVCDAAHEELVSSSASRVVAATHWSVPDPVAAGTDAAFDAAYDELAERVARLAPRLRGTAP